MDELKEAIIETVNKSKATHPVELYQELLVFLYTKGYKDGQNYVDVRDGYN